FWTNVKYLDAHILKQNEQLKYENPTEENKLKIKALQLERKDLQAQYRKVIKKMKTYDAGQEIVQENLKKKKSIKKRLRIFHHSLTEKKT
ncbi:hypothetical protein LLT5_12545, partial [Lactococcus cremoris subsp. cremoris TIFN5]